MRALETSYNHEEERVHKLYQRLRVLVERSEEASNAKDIDETILELKANLALHTEYTIKVEGRSEDDKLPACFKFVPVMKLDLKMLERKRPTISLVPNTLYNGKLTVKVEFLNQAEKRVLAENSIEGSVTYKMSLATSDGKGWKAYDLRAKGEEEDTYLPDVGVLESARNYAMKVTAVCDGKESEESEPCTFTTSETLRWKVCPDYVSGRRKYMVSNDGMKATKHIEGWSEFWSTIITSLALLSGKVTTVTMRIKRSAGRGATFFGVAPFDIDQNNFSNWSTRCGWFLSTYTLKLWSGAPHDYDEEGPDSGKEDGDNVHSGDSIGVVMDTTKGKLSFAVNGVNLGVAYEGIPLDKPLVPCVLFRDLGDSVKLINQAIEDP